MNYINSADAIPILTKLNDRNMLIPIIGSGFSGGAKSLHGHAPMVDELKKIMKNKILDNYKLCSEEELQNLSFVEISELFLDEKIVPLTERLSIFEKYFTNVNLPDYKKTFLRLWQYIYTINIDDGIERATNFTVIHPYSSLRENFGSISKIKSYVLKLHGDVNHELLINSDENIVFKPAQYISSMSNENNRQLIKSIRSDYQQKNIIFIGCSLDYEPDLQSIYDSISSDYSTREIFYLSKNRLSPIKESKLRTYGVNKIILTNNYNAFIKDLSDSILMNKQKTELVSYKYISPKIQDIENKNDILNIFSYGQPVFNIKNKCFEIPSCTAIRSLINNIIEYLNNVGIVIIKGRRLSGKTVLLSSIIRRVPSLEVIYFPSDTQVDETIVKNLFTEKTNTLFVFDSNSYSPQIYHILISYHEELLNKGNRILIATNTNEDNLIYRLNAASFLLQNTFNELELDDFNKKVDRLAFIHRTLTESSLDYSARIMKQFNKELKIVRYDISSMSIKQKTILYMLAVFDRLYFHEVTFLDLKTDDIIKFVDEYPILFEIVDCDPSESNNKSVKKLVHNSKFLLFNLILKMEKEDVSHIIQNIVRNLYLFDQEQYKAAIMFDTLNQLFSREGAASHIEYVYGNLEQDLCHEPHFWLQRAKSIYRLFKKDAKKLEIARQYAIKAYEDAKQNSNIKAKSLFTLSLICGLLYNLEVDKSKKENLLFSTIQNAYTALFMYDFIFTSIGNEIFTLRSKNSSFYTMLSDMCDICIENHTRELEITSAAVKLKHKLHNIKQQWYMNDINKFNIK